MEWQSCVWSRQIGVVARQTEFGRIRDAFVTPSFATSEGFKSCFIYYDGIEVTVNLGTFLYIIYIVYRLTSTNLPAKITELFHCSHIVMIISTLKLIFITYILSADIIITLKVML